ncbi:MAG: LuxR C-terminal-related transcriptional regulator [Actinomycetota bacterium]
MKGGEAVVPIGSWPWIDRGEAQRLLGAALRREQPRIIVTGSLGVGKTALVDRVLGNRRSAPERSVVRVRGRFPDRVYGALVPLLPAGVEPAPTDWQFTQQIRRFVTGSGDDLPALGVVDDLHLLDAASLAVVVSLVDDDGCGLVATSEAAAPVELAGVVDELAVRPLDDEQVDAMVRARVGVLDGRSMRTIRAHVEGNPLVIRQLVDGALDDGRFVERSGVVVADLTGADTESLERVVRRRRAALGRDAEETLDLLAFAEAMPIDGLDGGGLAELDDLGWFDRSTRRLALPLGVIRATSVRNERELSALAVAAIERSGADVELHELVRWEILAGRSVDDEQILSSAAEMARRWRVAEARQMVAAIPAPSIEARLLLADLDARSGDLHAAHRAFVVAAEDARSQREIGLATANLGEFIALRLGDVRGGLAIATAGLQRIDDPSAFVELAARQVMIAVLAGDVDSAHATRSAVREIGARADAGPRARFLANTTYFDVMAGDLSPDPAVDAAARVLAQLDDDHRAPAARTRLLLTEHLRLLHRGELLSAAALVDAELAHDRLGSASRGSWIVTRAEVQRLSGRPGDARRTLVAALEYLALDDDLGMADIARAELAGVLADLGELTRAREAAAEVVAHDPRVAARLARAEVRMVEGDRDDIAARLAGGVAETGFTVWAADVACEAIRVGPAPLSVALARDVGAEIDSELLAALIRLGEATIDDDLLVVHECASTLFEMGYATYGADAVALAMDLAARSGQRFLSPLAERARAAARDIPRLREVLGLIPPSPTDVLTERERQIVELAASGRSSKDIGRDLGISSRTVDNHLGAAYRKLGIGSRHELPASMRPAEG